MHCISKYGSLLFAVLFLSLTFSSTLLAQPHSQSEGDIEKNNGKEKQDEAIVYSNNPVVAEVGGQPLFLDDLKNVHTQEMMERLHVMLSDALKLKALVSLSETYPELKPMKTAEITDRDIENFYENEPGIKDLGPLDQLWNQIRNYLEKKQRQLALKDLDRKFQLAVEKNLVVNYLKPPNDFRLKANVGTAMLWFHGKDDTSRKVFVMEYSDFLCPFCRKVQKTLRDLRRKYSATVQFGYRHFPIHQEARDLSEAAECARDQGRFWQFQTLIFMNARRLQQDKLELIRHARLAGVRDTRSFEQCLDSGKYKERVQKDFEEGASLGIQGTPTFIIGIYNHSTATVDGEMFSGAVPPEKFINLIEKYLNHTQE